MNSYIVLVLFAIISNYFAHCQDNWVWPKTKNQKVLAYYPSAPKKVYYADELNSRADREREPTTRKPLPGEPANDEIEDYPDNNEQLPEKQNSPYLPGGQPGFGGQFGGGVNIGGGFPQYPQLPNAATPGNGILTGPGGPTGIIGRPQAQYPSAYPGQVGYPGFPSFNAGAPYAGGINPGFPNFNGVGTQQQYFPGQQQPSLYPDPSQQFGGGQYAGFTPQYTEGYGYTPLQPQPNFGVYPGGYGGYPGGFDEYNPQTGGKSANVKTNRKKIDDKVTKNLKN